MLVLHMEKKYFYVKRNKSKPDLWDIYLSQNGTPPNVIYPPEKVITLLLGWK